MQAYTTCNFWKYVCESECESCRKIERRRAKVSAQHIGRWGRRRREEEEEGREGKRERGREEVRE